MRSATASLGRRLGSAALRFVHPLAGIARIGEPPVGGVYRWSCGIEINPSLAVVGRAVRDHRLARLEAVLLLASEPLASRKIAQLANLADGTEARTLVRKLNQLYEVEAAAFCVEEVAGGYQLLTRPRFGNWLRRLYQSPSQMRLSTPALETLAVVAYRQPIVRAEVEAIRGVQSGEMIRQLMERDLVRITGRSPELGRPFLYGTTRQFLQHFGLRHLDELPRANLLKTSPEPDTTTNPIPTTPTNTRAGDLPGQETATFNHREEESQVRIAAYSDTTHEELLEEPAIMAPNRNAVPEVPEVTAAKEEEEEEFEDEDEDDDFDDEEDDEELDDEEEDLDEDEWEEVDDDLDDDFEDEEEWDDEDDWEDDDEDEEDDWEDDED